MSLIKTIHPKSRQEWRSWLEKNHDKETKVSLIKYKKHTGKPAISHKESMEEAICFGWIDTTVKRLDENRYIRNFSRRNKNSRWSNATQNYAKKMIKEKRMAPAGLKAYKEGLKKPVIDFILPENHKTPEDLIEKLNKNLMAKNNFDNLAPSYKKNYIRWIERAKLSETRKKRIKEVVKRCGEKRKFGLGN